MVAFQLSSVCSQTNLSVPGAAGVVHHDVDLAPPAHRHVDHGGDVLLFGHIGPHRDGRVADLGSNRLEQLEPARRSTTFAPSAASIFAITGPEPVLAPVTMATLSSNRGTGVLLPRG